MKELKSQRPRNNSSGENIYSKVGNEKRMALLNMVKIQGKSLKDAANILNINYSTAKTILRVYRIENRILKKTPHQKRTKKVFFIDKSSSDENSSLDLESENPNKTFLLNSFKISPQLTVESPKFFRNNHIKLHVTSDKKLNTSTLCSNENSPIESKKNIINEIFYEYQAMSNNLKFCVNELYNNEVNLKNLCFSLQRLNYPDLMENFKLSLSSSEIANGKLIDNSNDNFSKHKENIGTNNLLNMFQFNIWKNSNSSIKAEKFHPSGVSINSEKSNIKIIQQSGEAKKINFNQFENCQNNSSGFVHRPIPVNMKDIVNS
jgi:hypothetical protein